MATRDDVLVNLVIKGMPPDEVIRLANQTSGQLAIEMGKHFRTISDLHARMRQDIDAKEKKSTQEQIKDETARLTAVKRVYDDLERTAKRALNAQSNEWRRLMEHMENIKTVAEGVFRVIEGGFHTLEKFGEEIIRQTQIYNGLTGSIDQMREATHGEIADIDLISAKNRGFQKELELTDQQYGVLAAAAKKFADTTGGSAKEAMDKLIDGMATGQMRALKFAGIMVNAEQAVKKYAEAHGLVLDKLTEEQKLHAVQEEAIKKATAKTKEFGETALTVASALEIAFAKVKNAITGAAVAIGNIKLKKPEISEAELERMKQADAMVEARTGRDPGNYKRALEASRHSRDASNAAKEALKQNVINETADANFYDLYGSEPGARSVKDERADEEKAKALAKAAAAKRAAFEKEVEKTFRIMFGHKKGEMDTTGYDPTVERYPLLTEMGLGDLGSSGGALEASQNSELDKLMGPDGGNLDKLMAELDDKIVKPLTAKVQATEDEKKAANDAAGGGLMARLLFGPDGPDKSLEAMDAFEKASVASMGMITDAAHEMAGALGNSLSAMITGERVNKTLKDATNEILRALAARAAGEAVWETAKGLSMTALALFGNPAAGAAAGAHFAAAAAFGALAGGAGLLSRGLGSTQAERNAQAADEKRAEREAKAAGGGSGFGSGPRNSNDNGNQGGRPIVINVSGAIPGSEAEIGRNIAKALNAHAREAGGDILDQRRSA